MKKITLAAALLATTTGAFAANNLDQLANLGSQSSFRLLSEDLGATLSYKALAPAEALGITGFDIGLEVTATSLANADTFKAATGGSSINTLAVPKVHLHKGLPFGIDVGAFYGTAPSSNVKLTGAELRYAIVDGGIATPAIALRGTWTGLSGVDQLALNTKGVELSISKGFAMVTPYAGVGNIWVESTPNVAGVNWKKESFSETKAYLGLNFNMGLMNLAFEGDKTGNATSYGAKFGFRW